MGSPEDATKATGTVKGPENGGDHTDEDGSSTRNKLAVILAYLLVWGVSMIVYWFLISGSDAMGYSLTFLWIVLPVTTFVVSFVIGKRGYWGRGKWAAAPLLGVMYMLAEYGTFGISNNVAFGRLNAPEWGMLVAGAAVSVAGMMLGTLLDKKRSR